MKLPRGDVKMQASFTRASEVHRSGGVTHMKQMQRRHEAALAPSLPVTTFRSIFYVKHRCDQEQEQKVNESTEDQQKEEDTRGNHLFGRQHEPPSSFHCALLPSSDLPGLTVTNDRSFSSVLHCNPNSQKFRKGVGVEKVDVANCRRIIFEYIRSRELS